ncbi:MAG: hypothetical protein R3B09_09610 [Nannocystaceae bacterium]
MKISYIGATVAGSGERAMATSLVVTARKITAPCPGAGSFSPALQSYGSSGFEVESLASENAQ